MGPVAYDSKAANSCTEESLIRFSAGGLDVPSETIGADDPCDGFGGNRIETPRNHLRVYVNFNIPGVFDLDEMDEALERLATPEKRGTYSKLTYAVVTETWLKRNYETNADATLNWSGDTLFINEYVVREGRLGDLWQRFFTRSDSLAADVAGFQIRVLGAIGDLAAQAT